MKLIELISEKEIEVAVLGEYEKRFVLYKLANEQFKRKYSMDFEGFEKRNMIEEKGFSWEVEKDSMEWEHAVERYKIYGRKDK
ncbi:MAG: hypothetical protein ACUZ8H_12830 [Candidatus Anammoxibacter sp.]